VTEKEDWAQREGGEDDGVPLVNVHSSISIWLHFNRFFLLAAPSPLRERALDITATSRHLSQSPNHTDTLITREPSVPFSSNWEENKLGFPSKLGFAFKN
jgi:hypothetical protein